MLILLEVANGWKVELIPWVESMCRYLFSLSWFDSWSLIFVGWLKLLPQEQQIRQPRRIGIVFEAVGFVPITGKFCIHDHYLYHVFISIIDPIS